MPDRFTESVVEEAALGWLGGLGYVVLHGPGIAVGQPAAERTDPGYRDVVLEGRLRGALPWPDGSIARTQAPVIDLDDPDAHDRLAVNRFTAAEGQHTRRPDVVVFTQWPCRHGIAGKDDERTAVLEGGA